jgi:hypothetical protein
MPRLIIFTYTYQRIPTLECVLIREHFTVKRQDNAQKMVTFIPIRCRPLRSLVLLNIVEIRFLTHHAYDDNMDVPR